MHSKFSDEDEGAATPYRISIFYAPLFEIEEGAAVCRVHSFNGHNGAFSQILEVLPDKSITVVGTYINQLCFFTA